MSQENKGGAMHDICKSFVIIGMSWIASAMDFSAKIFAWDGSNNHKSFATHSYPKFFKNYQFSLHT